MFRRRRNRRFEVLAREPARAANPRTAVPHVHVLGELERSGGDMVALATGDMVALATEGPERPPVDLRPPPFRIRPVPIDERLGAVQLPLDQDLAGQFDVQALGVD